jgi:hypothetical protein
MYVLLDVRTCTLHIFGQNLIVVLESIDGNKSRRHSYRRLMQNLSPK